MSHIRQFWLLRSRVVLVIATAYALAAQGCITTQSGEHHDSDATLHLDGLAQQPNQDIGFYLLDRRNAEPGGAPPRQREIHDSGQFLKRYVRARSDAQPTSRRSGIYRWQVDVPTSALLGDWAVQVSETRAPGLATSLGRIELAAYPIRLAPGTADLLPAEEIVGARLWVTDAPAGADFDTFVAFDNDGVGLGPSPPAVRIATFLTTRAVLDVMFEVWTYEVGGAPVYGVMCQPTARAPDEPLRTLIWNHGGIRTDQEAAAATALGADTSAGVGLGFADLQFCENTARSGWRVAMSAYRYQGISRLKCDPTASDPTEPCRITSYSCGPAATLPPGFDLPLPGGAGSLRESEFCLSETADVMRWTQIVRGMPGVDPNAILMMGGSHGACVTLCAVEQGVQVKAAVALAPPPDFERAALAQAATLPVASQPAFYANGWPHLLGGRPDEVPEAYHARSPLRMAVDLQRRPDFPLLLAAEVDDPIVGAWGSCDLAKAVGMSAYFYGLDMMTLRYELQPFPSPSELGDCAEHSLPWSVSEPTWMRGGPTLLLYQQPAGGGLCGLRHAYAAGFDLTTFGVMGSVMAGTMDTEVAKFILHWFPSPPPAAVP